MAKPFHVSTLTYSLPLASRRPFKSARAFALLFLAAGLIGAQGQPFTPPPEPAVRPLIGKDYSEDADADHIADGLSNQVRVAQSAMAAARTGPERLNAQAALDSLVDVELIFASQVTQAQIDAFLTMGGQITYLYKAVSYGWNGKIPVGQVSLLPARMGASLLLVDQVKQSRMHLDTATRTGRVRPMWTPGFAGSSLGFEGTTNITIAICDSGTDESHPDLNGRRAYWHDFSTDGAASPTDVGQHGSHVMGIATGTGAAGGSGAGTLSFSDEGTLSGVPSGSFYPSPVELPPSSVTVTITAIWNGGGSTTLYLVYNDKGTSGGYTAQASVTGSSPLTLVTTFIPSSAREYSPALISNGAMTDYVTTSQITGYPGSGDGFNKFRGVAPGCRWATAKVFTDSGSGVLSWTDAAVDDLVANRVANKIKVMNLSLGAIGNPGLSTSTRQKINTAVNNGIVVVCSAGNDGGTQTVDDPGRAAMALTVAAANDVNQLTDYSSEGFTAPKSAPVGQEEDYKPDLMAPGGSAYYSLILSVDSNSGDGTAFPDQQPNDYLNIQGTSMASPFAAGCAALVVDALEQSGVTWNFGSSQHSRFVKMLLCATSTESNTNREGNTANPTLQRASTGPNSFPVGKDRFEGYGMINPDAAIEAVRLSCTNGITNSAVLGPAATDRRAWARALSIPPGATFKASLTVPAGGDFDLYLYSATPSAYGTPVLLASSTAAGNGLTESLTYSSAGGTNGILVVKRVAGSGTFNFVGFLPPVVNFTAGPTNGIAPLTVSFTNQSLGVTSSTWSFGDGATNFTDNPSHVYASPGTYTVRLIGANPTGTNSLTRSNLVVVGSPPTATPDFVAAPAIGPAPLAVYFTNLSSNAQTYLWSFGDAQTSTATNPVHVYGAGLYSVTLSAANTAGTNSLTRTNYILVTNPPPLVAFQADITNGLAPLTVNFTNLSSGAISSYLWTFGDGHTSTNANPANTYSNPGLFTVSLSAAGPGGTNMLARTNFVMVTNYPPPLVAFQADITNGLAPLTVNFTNLSSGALSSYLWTFGDGHTSTNANPANTYSNAGSFTVSLLVGGPGGTNVLALANFVVVTNYPPPLAAFEADITNGLAPLTVNFTNLSSGVISSYLWDFGDGHTSTNANPANTYSNAGSFTVSLLAAGPGGTNMVALTNFVVATNYPPPLVAFEADTTNGLAPLTVNFTNLSSGAISSYLWDFGDGHTSTNANPANTYSNAGSFTVNLLVAGPGGTNVLVLTNYIVATNLPALLAVEPGQLLFGLLPTGAIAQANLVVSNAGQAILNGSASLAAGPFSVLTGSAFSLVPGATTNVVVEFMPVIEGVFTNVLDVVSDGGSASPTLFGRALNPPLLTDAAVAGTNFTFSFSSVAGFSYRIQYKDEVDGPTWYELMTVAGDGTKKTVSVPSAEPWQRYYRIVAE